MALSVNCLRLDAPNPRLEQAVSALRSAVILAQTATVIQWNVAARVWNCLRAGASMGRKFTRTIEADERRVMDENRIASTECDGNRVLPRTGRGSRRRNTRV